MADSDMDSQPSKSSPKIKGLDFVPEYAVEDGVAHTYNGTLFVPTPEEFERLKFQREMTPEVNPVCLAVEESKLTVAIHKGRIQGRVKMSAGDLIRLGATKPRG